MHIGAYLLVLFVCLFVLLASNNEMYVQFIKVQVIAYTGGHFFVFMQPFLALPAGPKVECRFSVLPRLPPFFASLCTVTGVNEARLAMITPFIGITKKKLNEEKVGVSLAVEGPPVKSFRGGQSC